MEQVRVNVNYSSEFEWDNLNSKEGLEVWAIRLPIDVSALESMPGAALTDAAEAVASCGVVHKCEAR